MRRPGGSLALVVLTAAGCSASLDELERHGPAPPASSACESTELHVIALAEPYRQDSGPSGVVDVHVERAGPIVLFIFTVRAAEWRVTTGPDTDLQAVFIQSEEGPAEVRAPIPDAAITRIGRADQIPCVGYQRRPEGVCSDGWFEFAGVEARVGIPVTSYVAVQRASRITVGADLRFDSDSEADRYLLLGLVFDACRVPRDTSSPECSGLDGLGRSDAFMCTAGLNPTARPFATRAAVTCEEALAVCRFNVGSSPWLSLRCQWEGRTLLLHQPTYFCWNE